MNIYENRIGPNPRLSLLNGRGITDQGVEYIFEKELKNESYDELEQTANRAVHQGFEVYKQPMSGKHLELIDGQMMETKYWVLVVCAYGIDAPRLHKWVELLMRGKKD